MGDWSLLVKIMHLVDSVRAFWAFLGNLSSGTTWWNTAETYISSGFAALYYRLRELGSKIPPIRRLSELVAFGGPSCRGMETMDFNGRRQDEAHSGAWIRHVVEWNQPVITLPNTGNSRWHMAIRRHLWSLWRAKKWCPLFGGNILGARPQNVALEPESNDSNLRWNADHGRLCLLTEVLCRLSAIGCFARTLGDNFGGLLSWNDRWNGQVAWRDG
jgi:hypothetical protein